MKSLRLYYAVQILSVHISSSQISWVHPCR